MNAPFKNIEPADADPNPRAAMGGNNPPLEESILLEFDEALRGREGLIERIDTMVERTQEVKPCTTPEQAGRYGDFIKMASTAAKVVEEEREKLNRPILNAGRALKARADSYGLKATTAGQRVRAELDKYLAKVEADRRAEEARLAAIAREAEAERQRKIRAAEEEAEAERKRLQKIEDDKAEAERQRLQAIEDERAAAEQRDVETVVVEVKEVEQIAAWVPEPEPVYILSAPPKAPVRGDYGTAVSTRETWHVEVLNIRQVPDAYLKHPSVLEAVQKVIGPAVRGANGLREIKGCRIYSTLGSAVR